MKKLVLIDGNNLMFRSYFATAYTGNIMKNSKGFPTNALYGFVSMLNKIIAEENPTYLAVAFDIGKNFRKEKYAFYKEGRNATPDDLKIQMPVARKILDGMGIKYLELAPYEADDIIGTLVEMAAQDQDFDATIISSDKDLLQLINFETDMKLLKKDTFIRYNNENFKSEWGIDPIRIIDLKALMGDASDNIPGVKGIGEKTALKLLQEYESLEGVYNNIESIKGATKQKLIDDKDNAFMSKEIATIYKSVPLNISLDALAYTGPNDTLTSIFEELEFYSLIKKIPKKSIEISYEVVNDLNSIKLENPISLYMELDNENYHIANIIGIALTDANNTYYFDSVESLNSLLENKTIYTYDYKKDLSKLNFKSSFDLMIAAYLLNKVVKDDITSLMSTDMVFSTSYNDLKKNDITKEELIKSIAVKSKYIYDFHDKYADLIEKEDMHQLFYDIEMPLANVLSQMENMGMKCEKTTLDAMKIEFSEELSAITKEIYTLAGHEFNISSPKQLGEVLFTELNIADGKKNKTGFKTDVAVLNKLVDRHPIVEKIIAYRNLSKIYSTYIEGLEQYIGSNGIIHPIFKQTLARTGRLSCVEPNLQNIPTKAELGKQIRKAFVPQNDLFLSADYSQIELRILAHIANCQELITAFNNDEDIHRHVAADIYGIKESDVTPIQRKTAKAVIFGIVYGISGFGLGANLHIPAREAQEFIEKYYTFYPGVKRYMEDIVDMAKKDGFVTTMFGRKRVLEELNNPNYMIRQTGERMALNTPIQGTSADIIKIAMNHINHQLSALNLKSKMVLQVHDELIFDVVESEREKVSQIVEKEMTSVVKLSVPLKVKITTGTDWYSL
jgi:DNA polymerase I